MQYTEHVQEDSHIPRIMHWCMAGIPVSSAFQNLLTMPSERTHFQAPKHDNLPFVSKTTSWTTDGNLLSLFIMNCLGLNRIA